MTAAAGCVSWARAATSMAAVQAAEARVLGPEHTAEMPGEDELALVAHDARLAALVIVNATPGRAVDAPWAVGAALVLAPGR